MLSSRVLRMAHASRSLRFAVENVQSPMKRTTGLVGLEVRLNAREELIALYEKSLVELEELPKGNAYRDAATSITKHRLETCKKFTNHEEIEQEIDCGQLEELIKQAENELELIEYFKTDPL